MGFIRQKLGPLELWQWAAIALVGILSYFYFTKSGFFSGSGSSGTSPGSGTGDTSLTDLLNALASMGQPANSGASGSNAPNAPNPSTAPSPSAPAWGSFPFQNPGGTAAAPSVPPGGGPGNVLGRGIAR